MKSKILKREIKEQIKKFKKDNELLKVVVSVQATEMTEEDWVYSNVISIKLVGTYDTDYISLEDIEWLWNNGTKCTCSITVNRKLKEWKEWLSNNGVNCKIEIEEVREVQEVNNIELLKKVVELIKTNDTLKEAIEMNLYTMGTPSDYTINVTNNGYTIEYNGYDKEATKEDIKGDYDLFKNVINAFLNGANVGNRDNTDIELVNNRILNDAINELRIKEEVNNCIEKITDTLECKNTNIFKFDNCKIKINFVSEEIFDTIVINIEYNGYVAKIEKYIILEDNDTLTFIEELFDNILTLAYDLKTSPYNLYMEVKNV